MIAICLENEWLVRECGQAALPSRTLKLTHLEELFRLLEQDGSDVARWYVINVLLDHKVAVSLEFEQRTRVQ